MIKMIKATIATMKITPVHTPALNIPSIAEQLVRNIEAARKNDNVSDVFIVNV